jgi:hypothetical protein
MDNRARYYDETKNPEKGELPGVPLRDLTADEFAALPQWLQDSVDALPCYRKTPPPRETAPLKGAAATATTDDAADGRKEA